jgi:hypothetical protein
MSDSSIARTLRKLERADAKPASVVETAASFMRLNPRLTDDDIASGLQCDPALVARVRGNLAAGRPPTHGLERPSLRAHGPEPASEPPPRSTPALPAAGATAPPRACGDPWPGRPTYTVTLPDGTVTAEIATWAAAADVARHYGGKVAVVKR